MSSIEKLANIISEMSKKEHIGITTGIVISNSPLKVQWGEKVIINESKMVISQSASSLAAGDVVIMIPNDDYSVWYMMAKVG